MNYLQFKELQNFSIDIALIDAITLDTYALEVIIDKKIYQVRLDNNNHYYATSLHQLHEDLKGLNIHKVYLHESLSFHPSLGFKGDKDKDILLDKDFKPVHSH